MRRLTLIVLSLATLLLIGCGSKQDTAIQGAPSVPVVAALPTVEDISVYVESVGKLRPSVYAEIRPSVSGKISEILVEEGEWVEKDTPLFKIGSSSYQVRFDEHQAQMATNRATLACIQKKLARCRALADKSLIAQAEWDDLETQEAKAQAAVDADQAKLKTVQGDLEKCTVSAPLAGRIGKLDVHYKLPVSPHQALPLATISQMDPLLLEFTITEKEFATLLNDQKEVEVQSLCSHCKPMRGVITFLDNQFDQTTGLLLVRAKVPNPFLYLRPGQSVRVRVPVSTMPNAILIPQKAVKYNQQGPYVFVMQPDSTVAIRPLTVGNTKDDKIIITDGLNASERVITEGHLRLYPGAKVEAQ